MKTVDVREDAGLGSASRKSVLGGIVAEGDVTVAGRSHSMPALAAREGVSVPEFDELEEYMELSMRAADDPDATPSDRHRELMRKYATQGAAVGVRHGMPIYISVDSGFAKAAAGVTVGINHAG